MADRLCTDKKHEYKCVECEKTMSNSNWQASHTYDTQMWPMWNDNVKLKLADSPYKWLA